MAEGIKIRQLDELTGINDSDVLVLDVLDGITSTSSTTKNIRYDSFVTDVTSRDLIFTGDLQFKGASTPFR